MFESTHAKFLGVLYLILIISIIASQFFVKNKEELRLTTAEIALVISILAVYAGITIFVINCMVIGDCAVGAGIIAFLYSIPLILTIAGLIFLIANQNKE